MSSEEVLKKLRDYYDKHCKKLVFINEKKLSTNNNCRMYYLDALEEQELLNYKKLFQEYLVFYIKNKDNFNIYRDIKNASTVEEISKALIEQGKIVHDDRGVYPNTEIKRQGLYGELFDDFYLNIVKQEEVIMTYSIRHGFNIPNSKGVDLVAAKVDNANVTIIYSEAKFVDNVYAASSSLVDDIKGTKNQCGHVTEDYLNEYTSFFIDQNHSLCFDPNTTEIIRNKIIELNSLMVNEELMAIEALNELSIKIRFDFFAVYHDNNFQIEERKDFFDKIANQFRKNIELTGLNNYDIEIIFIPTKNTSMSLKEEFEKWD